MKMQLMLANDINSRSVYNDKLHTDTVTMHYDRDEILFHYVNAGSFKYSSTLKAR